MSHVKVRSGSVFVFEEERSQMRRWRVSLQEFLAFGSFFFFFFFFFFVVYMSGALFIFFLFVVVLLWVAFLSVEIEDWFWVSYHGFGC
jgi:hypothetical protein